MTNHRPLSPCHRLYQSGQAELVALYGRRRVRKAFLIDETFAGRIDFRHAGLSPVDEDRSDEGGRKSRMKDQLRHFHRSLAEQGLQGAEAPRSRSFVTTYGLGYNAYSGDFVSAITLDDLVHVE